MHEPSGSRRRRRTGRSPRLLRWVSGRGAVTAMAVFAAVLAVVTALSIALGGSGIPTDRSPAMPAVSDFPPVPTGPPAAAVSFPPVAPPSVNPSLSPAAARGIRATRIEIRRLEIDLKIVEGDGIDAPIGKAAHYPGTSWPDGGTNIYIYAHARTGMFLSLWDAEVGDEVVLTLVDDTKRTYIVDEVLPRVPWDAIRYLAPTPTEQLTMQTSTSNYGTAPRFVVVAHPSP